MSKYSANFSPDILALNPELAALNPATKPAKRPTQTKAWRAFSRRMKAAGWEQINGVYCWQKGDRKFYPFNWTAKDGVNWHRFKKGGLPE